MQIFVKTSLQREGQKPGRRGLIPVANLPMALRVANALEEIGAVNGNEILIAEPVIGLPNRLGGIVYIDLDQAETLAQMLRSPRAA